jgi:hypothetical protein
MKREAVKRATITPACAHVSSFFILPDEPPSDFDHSEGTIGKCSKLLLLSNGVEKEGQREGEEGGKGQERG